jgi:hypothetical protein
MPPLLTLKVGREAGYVMSGVLRVSTRIAVLTIIFALATYTALTIQTHIGNSLTFNRTLGLDSPLIIGGYGLYLNLVAIITNAVLVTIAYSLLAKDKPRTGLVRYSLGIVAVYAILSATLYLAVTANPAQVRTSMPMNLDGIATFTASIVIGSVTIGAYGPIDGLVTAPLLGLLAGYIVMSTSTIMNKQ